MSYAPFIAHNMNLALLSFWAMLFLFTAINWWSSSPQFHTQDLSSKSSQTSMMLWTW